MGDGVRIALVEDDIELAQLMGLWLKEAGYSYQHYTEGKTFLRDLQRESFDLLVLDWMLPDMNGDQILLLMRERNNRPLPVIFVTARDTEEDIVRGLSLGADDYMTKPLRRNEFLARLGAVGRRAYAQTEEKARLQLPPYEVDTASRTIMVSGKPVELTQKEYELAFFLLRNVGRILSRGHILESVWGQAGKLNTRTVDTHISRIRSKLGFLPENGWRLSSVYTHGYRLEQLSAESIISDHA
jgi:two-component system, OmpR family, response regulator RegX3